jgi:hypothetical protein
MEIRVGVGREEISVGGKVGVGEAVMSGAAVGDGAAGNVAAGDMISTEKLQAASTMEPSRKTMNRNDDLE